MTIRTPRGYAVNRPYYQEICEGVRPTFSAVPLTAWTGLPAITVDELHNDPIVLPAGTLIGVSPQSAFRGIAFPATAGTAGITYTAYTSQDSLWGLPASTISSHHSSYAIKPIGVAYKPVYSHYLQANFTNYLRSYAVEVVTDYVIQIPCVWSGEYAIQPGDLVCATTGASWGPSLNFHACPAGRYAKYDGAVSTNSAATAFVGYSGAVQMTGTVTVATTVPANPDFIVGRCLSVIDFATTAQTAGTTAAAAFAASDLTLSTAGAAEWKGLSKVQTVPGLGLSGSGTAGVPGWLMGARANNGTFRAMTILIRL